MSSVVNAADDATGHNGAAQVVGLDEVRAWSRDRGRSVKMSDETALAITVGSVERAVAGADFAG